jgi:hypothetical protein
MRVADCQFSLLFLEDKVIIIETLLEMLNLIMKGIMRGVIPPLKMSVRKVKKPT